MNKNVNAFQQWVWEGFNNGVFSPDGDLSYDEHDNDIFTGFVHHEAVSFEVAEFGPVIEAAILPCTVFASMAGHKLANIIELPSCGDKMLDTKVNNILISEIIENNGKISLILEN